MKSCTLVLLLVMASCGKRTHNHYIENPFDNTQNEERLNDIERRVSAIESQFNANITQIQTLEQSLNSQEALISSLQDALVTANGKQSQALQSAINAGIIAYNELFNSIESLNVQTVNLQSTLATLQTNSQVVQIINPCPSVKATYEEVILKLQNNKYIAFFENGGKRFLTKLEKDVVYQTTDERACRFKIKSNNQIESL